jgi:hypothetical protein
MKRVFLGLLVLVYLVLEGQAYEIDLDPREYSSVSDIYHPTLDDLRAIQYALSYAPRPLIKRLGDREFVSREFKIIGDSPEEIPQRGMHAVHSDNEERENCIIVYSSFNKNYPQGVHRLVNSITNSDFQGHVHFQIGGWPNLEEGDLVLAHVPYAFKVCFFREMKRWGYKRVLWLDASILPSKFTSLNHIFELIKENGYFVQGNDHNIGPYFNEEAAKAFGMTLEETQSIPSCSSAIVGIDLTSSFGSDLLDAWFDAANHPCAYYSPRPEQSALTLVFYRMGITQFTPITTLAKIHTDNPQSLFIMDRDFVKY